MRSDLDISNDWHADPDVGRAEHAARTRDLRRAIPDVYAGFASLHDAAMRPGALGRGTKELMALAIAVTQGCERCIDIHVRAAVHEGADAAEVAEALGVAVLMAGGPGTSYAPVAWAAFRRAVDRQDDTTRAG